MKVSLGRMGGLGKLKQWRLHRKSEANIDSNSPKSPGPPAWPLSSEGAAFLQVPPAVD